MDKKKLEDLIRLVEDSDIHKLEISGPFRSVKITKSRSHAEHAPTPAPERTHAEHAPAPAEPAEPAETHDRDSGLVPIVSPMVGTFYASPSPDDPPYIRQGDRVNKGQIVCIVEAMKIINEIESEVSGTMVRVLVENAQAIEYGQELFLVQPD
ncbi:MAG: acetyl-CoA carboxylase biotin carboxyl carrier protein [Candidatus Eisenbacteria bacterium]